MRATSPEPDSPADEPGRKPGRPRSESCCDAIRCAALELLVERGFAELTIEGVAARAGVGKATVYRRHASKAELVVGAFFAEVSPRVRFDDTGDVREDFRRQMRLAVRELRGPQGRVLATLLGCAQSDPEVAESFRTRWLALRRAEGRVAVERAIDRGEIPRGTEPDFVLDALYAPLYFRLLIQHQPLDAALVDGLIDTVFAGLAERARAPRRASAGAPRARRASARTRKAR